MQSTVTMLGVIGAVVLIAALSSGLLERHRLPQVLLFLVLGTAIGPYGLGLFDFGVHSPTVAVVATLGLVLVLFTDAVSVAFADVRRHTVLAAIGLGPGTVLTGLVIGLAAHLLLGTGAAASAILGAALASTDPVLLRGVLRNPATPEPARNALRLESGMNDAVLLPVVIVTAAMLAPADGAAAGWPSIVLRVLLLGAGAGLTVGLLAVRALDIVRRRIGIRRDYESLYVIAVALTAFAVAETLTGSGFIAAFTAGVTIAALDVELCECFYDYGEASAEMALLFTFVILGSSAIWSGLGVISPQTLLFAAVALFARTVIMAVALAPVQLDRSSRMITIWFGPRGLSSLLLVLLAVFAGVPGSEFLFAVTALAVLFSVVIHGGSQILLPTAAPLTAAALRGASGAAGTSGAAETSGAARAGDPGSAADPGSARDPGSAAGVSPTDAADVGAIVSDRHRITLDELAHLETRGVPVTIVDVRKQNKYSSERLQPVGAIRIPSERTSEAIPLLGLPKDTWLVLYCT